MALTQRFDAVECPAFDARRRAREAASGAEHAAIVFSHGLGANVVDVDDNRYVDLAAGFGSLVLGHCPERLAEALARQKDRLWLALGDLYGSEAKLTLVERLAALFPEPGARVMLGLSGADAVTAALKTAVLSTGRDGVIAFRGSYHGLSYGPLAACGLSEAFRAPFSGQLGDHVTFVPYPTTDDELDGCMTQVTEKLARRDVGAVLVEPMLGRGGCIVPPSGFLRALRTACDDSRALLVADEIWTGLGRCGAWLASSFDDVVPDLLCIGKALGGGMPISACVGRERVMESWGAHGGATIHTATHFGSPLACVAALATLDAIGEERLDARAVEVGERWMARLRGRTQGRGVTEVRGRGFMVGVALEGGAGRALAVARGLLARGYIVVTGGASGDVLTLSPPLIIHERLLDAFSDAFAEALGAV